MSRSISIPLLATLAAFVTAAAADAQRVALAPFTFTFTTQGGASTEADSGTLVVPMNRAGRGAGKTVALPLVRFRATTPQPGPPVIYLSGGSGSGISAAGDVDVATTAWAS
ncbi:MAG TPA: hypothetical protein VF541_19020, partial [Longimicrobium sp.]